MTGPRRWPFPVQETAADDRWLIVDPAGRFLCCWIDGQPEWCSLRGNARRYSAADASRALQALEAVGLEAAAMVGA